MHKAEHNSDYMLSKLDQGIYVGIWKLGAQKYLPDDVTWLPFGLHFTKIQNKHLDQVTSDVMLSIQYILEE